MTRQAPWLMEINTTPSLHAAEPDGSDAKVKARMLYDLLSLSDAIPERHVPPEAALQVQ